jgi:cytochrome c-type biogenesis protein
VAIALVAIATLAGRQVSLAVPTARMRVAARRPAAILLYGVGYGLASLGCTLPVFLVVIGASLATNGPLAALGVFGAYALGMALVLMALSIGAGLLRDGLARALGRAIPHLRRINGGLLLLVSAYSVDYWGSVLSASADSRADHPLVGFVPRSTTLVQTWVTTLGGRWLLAGAAAIVALTALVALWQWTLRPRMPPTGTGARSGRHLPGPTPPRLLATKAPDGRIRPCPGK